MLKIVMLFEATIFLPIPSLILFHYNLEILLKLIIYYDEIFDGKQFINTTKIFFLFYYYFLIRCVWVCELFTHTYKTDIYEISLEISTKIFSF